MTRTRSVPWLIVLVGAGFIVFTVWSFYRAAHGTSAVTDADYYSHGLRYNQTLLEQKAAASLGWNIVPNLRGKLVTIQLRDRDQRLVAGALGTLTMLGTSTPEARELILREAGFGIYQAEVPAGVQGEQTVEIMLQRDGAKLNRRLLLFVD
jgi:nitrogen fixation protein FixH